MAKSFLSINKNQVSILSTLAVILILGAGYFFVYVPANEKDIQAQRFRALQNVDKNVHEKIENSVALINNLLENYSAGNSDHVINFLENQSNKNYTFTSVVSLTTTAIKQNTDSVCIIRVDSSTKLITLYLSKRYRDSTFFQLGMNFTPSQFVGFLLPENVFDDYIIFSNNRTILETFPSGISYVIKDSLFRVKTSISSSSVVEHNISGKDYKMFLQSVSLDAKTELVIGGLLTNKRYQHEKTQLPTPIVLLLATILLISIVLFPWIKLFQMGSKDRLTITDAVSTLFISMLLMSLLFFAFFKYNHPLQPAEPKDPKIVLANGIEKAFKEEIKLMYDKIVAFDVLRNKESLLRSDDIINLFKKTHFSYIKNGKAQNDSTTNKNSAALKDHAILNTSKDISINQAFWLDSNGFETVNWNTEPTNAPHGNYARRDYYKNIINHKYYFLNADSPDPSSPKKYYLEQSISWTTGSFRSIVAVPSVIDKGLAALSVNMRSLDSAVLPTGYLFAIINNRGKVLYHSQKVKNLNENLIDEFSDDKTLRSCLEARSEGTFTTRYFSNKYKAIVRPLNDLPYFIVILEDSMYKETMDTEIFSFTVSMLMLFFGFLVIQLLVVFFVSARRSFFKNQVFDTSWIGPKIAGNDDYILSSVFNLLTIIALFVTFSSSAFLQYFFMLLYSITLVPLYLNFILFLKYRKQKKNVIQFKQMAIWCLCAFLIVIEICASLMLTSVHFLVFLLFQLLLVVFGIAVYYFKDNILDKFKSMRQNVGAFRRWDYINTFTLMGLTRLIVTSGIPVVFFYVSSYNYEENLATRYRHVNYLNKLANKMPDTLARRIINNGEYAPGNFVDSNSVLQSTVISEQEARQKYKVSYSREDSITIKILHQFRLFVTDLAVNEDRFNSSQSADSSFFFNNLPDSAWLDQQGTYTCRPAGETGDYIQIQSANLNYHFPNLHRLDENYFLKGLLFWLLLLTGVVAYYFIVLTIIKKLFSLNVPDLSVWKALDDNILSNNRLNNLVFVIGLPGAGKKYHILHKISTGEIRPIENESTKFAYKENDDGNNNVFLADLINIPDDSSNDPVSESLWQQYCEKVFSKKNKFIIVNHFEYNIQDPISNRRKLNFLERLTLDEDCKIFILSTIHPVAFLDSVFSQSAKKEDSTIGKGVPGEDLERWHVLLGHYRIVLLPLDLSVPPAKGEADINLAGTVLSMKHQAIAGAKVSVKNTDTSTQTDSSGMFKLAAPYQLPFTITIEANTFITEDVVIREESAKPISVDLEESFNNWKSRIRSETHYTHFLHKIQQAAIQVGSHLTEHERMQKCDELAFKLQVTSHYFYMYIWQSLTKEEKFLLYDLAEDNLVNSFDSYNLSMLVGKGIIVNTDGSLKLFNKGFRNFILTAIGNTEAIKIKDQIKDNGNWGKLKNPLLIMIMAILGFLLTSQQESYTKIITYLAALGAGVPAVLKIFSIFEKPTDKQN
jgi:hypothetical protein